MRLWALCAATWVSRAGFQSSTGEQSRWSQCPRHILRDSLPLCSVGGCFPTRSAEDVLCVALLCLQEGSGGEAEGESSSVEVEEGRRKAPLPICASSALAAPLPSSGAHLICGIAQLAGAARNVGRLQLPCSWCCRRKERCVWGGSVAVLPPTPCPPAPASSACSSAGLSWAALWLSRGGQSPGRGGSPACGTFAQQPHGSLCCHPGLWWLCALVVSAPRSAVLLGFSLFP